MLTPVKSIRAKCLDCCGGAPSEVRLCPASNCPLIPYRMGHRPKEGKDTAPEADEEKSAESPQFFDDTAK